MWVPELVTRYRLLAQQLQGRNLLFAGLVRVFRGLRRHRQIAPEPLKFRLVWQIGEQVGSRELFRLPAWRLLRLAFEFPRGPPALRHGSYPDASLREFFRRFSR